MVEMVRLDSNNQMVSAIPNGHILYERFGLKRFGLIKKAVQCHVKKLRLEPDEIQ